MPKYVEVPDELYENIEDLMDEHGYSTFTEFTKESIRFRARDLRSDNE
jgi:hypothetical protein